MDALYGGKDAMPLFTDYQRNNPSCPPDWRWARACALAVDTACPSRLTDDEPTVRAVSYLRALDSTHCPERLIDGLIRTYPDLHAAHHLRDHGGDVRWELEARLLAGQAAREVAALTGVDAAT